MQKTAPPGHWIEEVYLGSDGLFCFISTCKFGSFENSFANITSLSELYFRFRRLILLVQMKNMISVTYGSSTSRWKPQRLVRLDLILSMRDIYIISNLNPLTKFSSSSRNTEFKDNLLPWNISWSCNTVLNAHRVVFIFSIIAFLPVCLYVYKCWSGFLVRNTIWCCE